MTTNYEHYITRNIRAYYKKRILPPFLYLVLLIALWVFFPLRALLAPGLLSLALPLEESYATGDHYVLVELKDLTFTGYTSQRLGSTKGYWYYGVSEKECFLILLTPASCEEGLPQISEVTVSCQLVPENPSYDRLLAELADDLDWTAEGISGQLPQYYLSEPDFHPITNFFLFLIYFGSGLFAFGSLLRYILFFLLPGLSPACQDLVVYGNPFMQLEEAEEELATLPQLATEDMFITEHYFILTSPEANAIVPISEILWIYKYSTLQKFLWYHFSITYTLHISANKHLFIQCPKNTKSDIDGIIDYLSEANHNIKVGFNEENRLYAQANQGKPFHVEKFYAFLRKKV